MIITDIQGGKGQNIDIDSIVTPKCLFYISSMLLGRLTVIIEDRSKRVAPRSSAAVRVLLRSLMLLLLFIYLNSIIIIIYCLVRATNLLWYRRSDGNRGDVLVHEL